MTNSMRTTEQTSGAMPQNQVELIAFCVGRQEFCVDIMDVREIRGWVPATPMPHAPEFVRGVINLRGTVLPVVDLARRLGQPPSDPTDRHAIIVAQVRGQTVGLLVEAVSDILSIGAADIQPPPDVAQNGAAVVRGLIAMDGRMLSLMAADDLLPATIPEAA